MWLQLLPHVVAIPAQTTHPHPSGVMLTGCWVSGEQTWAVTQQPYPAMPYPKYLRSGQGDNLCRHPQLATNRLTAGGSGRGNEGPYVLTRQAPAAQLQALQIGQPAQHRRTRVKDLRPGK